MSGTGKKPPAVRSSRTSHVRDAKNETKELGCDCKDSSSSSVLPLEPFQYRKRRKQRRSLTFAFSEASAVLFAEPCAVAASLSMGIVRDVVAVPQQSRHR